MREKATKENALEALIGAAPEDLPSDYPAVVYLPENIHERALDAINNTADDFRERSINFSYGKDRWMGGIALRGPALNGDRGASTNLPHGIISLFSQPHLLFHTHPHPNQHHVDQATENIRKRGGKTEQEILEDELYYSRFMEQTFALPSGNDVTVAFANSQGAIGGLISSEGGHFLQVLKNVHEPNLRPFSNVSGNGLGRKSIEAGQKQDNLMQNIVDSYPLGNDAQQKILDATAVLLSSKYVCYFSDDPENAELKKLKSL